MTSRNGEDEPGAHAEAEPISELIERIWSSLPVLDLKARDLDRNRIVTAARHDPAHAAFDVLRARLVEALARKKWRRVGITSPTKGCGKSFTAVNLAVALSRLEDCRTELLDLDMRHPGLARTLGVRAETAMADLLRNRVPMQAVLRRVESKAPGIGRSLAVGLGNRTEPFAAEILAQRGTSEAILRIEAMLDPRIVLLDLPPALAQDDVIAMKPNLDCVLLVVGGGKTTSRDLQETTRRLGEDLPVLGVVLNQGQGRDVTGYTY